MERQTSTFTSWEKLRDLDLVAFLTSIVYGPCKTSGTNYWYLSSLRTEKTASFKVNTRLNRWWDFGIGKGGSIIDFCLEYYKTELSEIVRRLSTQVFAQSPPFFPQETFSDQPALRITEVCDLSCGYLKSYLRNRGITVQLAASVVKQVHYNLNGRSYYGLGFQNDLW
ncbi:CHC2 zinc finger domain-containing protein [Ravibacter arvi]|uniref:CHC2 zinc finger domain-containing protein n=1 Tax=Ravibacter arvi TaxID=2051041 RepID=UPI003CD0567F